MRNVVYCEHTDTCIHTHRLTHALTHSHSLTHTQLRAHTCTHLHMRAHTCTHAHMHTCTHYTHAHMHAYALVRLLKSTLGGRGGVGKREDERTLAVLGHFTNLCVY